jgi:hypothetical protein
MSNGYIRSWGLSTCCQLVFEVGCSKSNMGIDLYRKYLAGLGEIYRILFSWECMAFNILVNL